MGVYIRLVDYNSQQAKEENFLRVIHKNSDSMYFVDSESFHNIPESPVAYWVKPKIYEAFIESKVFPAETRKGILTGDNNRFLRLWFEVSKKKIGTVNSYEEMIESSLKWFFVTSGGPRRNWYGNIDTVVNLENGGTEIINNVKNYRLRETKYYFKESIAWTEVSTNPLSCRYTPSSVLFGNGGPSCFFNNGKLKYVLGLLNSVVTKDMMSYLAPTMNYGPDQISRVPVKASNEDVVEQIVEENICHSKKDWDSFETSWDFKKHPLL